MKGVVAVNAAFQSADFAMHEIFIDDIHGINGVYTGRYHASYGRDRITGNDRNGEDDRRYFTGKRGIETIYRVIFE